jgi:hypothetical protein
LRLVLGLDGAVHRQRKSLLIGGKDVTLITTQDCAPVEPLRTLPMAQLEFFSRWCPLCFPERKK